jgi:hypothetical protein
MCDLEKGKLCNNYSACPVLISITQRNYMNRTLDDILKTLNRIERQLEVLNNGKNNGHR